MKVIQADPAVENVAGNAQRHAEDTGSSMFMLKPLAERKISADQVIARLRPKTAAAGASLVPAVASGHSYWRPRQQFSIPVHASGRHDGRLQKWAGIMLGCDQDASAIARFQHRPAEQGAASASWSSIATPRRVLA